MSKYAEEYKESFQKEAINIGGMLRSVASKVVKSPLTVAAGAGGVAGSFISQDIRDFFSNIHGMAKDLSPWRGVLPEDEDGNIFTPDAATQRKNEAEKLRQSHINRVKQVYRAQTGQDASDDEIDGWLTDANNKSTYSKQYAKIKELSTTGEGRSWSFKGNKDIIGDMNDPNSYASITARGIGAIDHQWGVPQDKRSKVGIPPGAVVGGSIGDAFNLATQTPIDYSTKDKVTKQKDNRRSNNWDERLPQ